MTVVYTSETPQQSPAETSELRPTEQGPLPIYGFEWRRDGRLLISYLLDTEVHTFAFSVAANAILSFIPFIVLLYTIAPLPPTAHRTCHSQALPTIPGDMVRYLSPPNQDWVVRNLAEVVPRSGV